jgi:hypothetical protein
MKKIVKKIKIHCRRYLMLSFLESLGIRFVNKIEELYTQGAKECLEAPQIYIYINIKI